MRIDWLKWKNTIFGRLLLVYMVVIIPIYISGTVIYSWGIQTVSNEIGDSMRSQVRYTLNELEAEIERMKSLLIDCLGDDDLSKLVVNGNVMDDFEKSQLILRLKKRLLSIKNSSPHIKDVTAYILPMEKSISAIDGNTELEVALSKKITAVTSKEVTKLFEADQHFYLCVQPLYLSFYDNGIPSYFLVIELSKTDLKGILEQFNNYDGSGSIIFNDRREVIISSGSQTSAQKWAAAASKNASTLKSGMRIREGDEKYLVVQETSAKLGMTCLKYVPEKEIFKTIDRYKVVFYIFSLISLGVIVLFLLSTYKMIHKPLLKLVNAFLKVEDGNLGVRIQYRINNEFKFLYERFNMMLENLGSLFDQVYKQKLLAQKAELKQLQSQINPHFLYNSFYLLHHMIKLEDYENCLTFSGQLGDYFKYITRSAAEEVRLEKEVEHARSYAEIQKHRFSNRVSLDFGDLPEDMGSVIVPRLILQPLIENAFEHGMKDKVSGGLIRIAFEKTAEGMNIVVEDNGLIHEGTDMENIAQSLENTDEHMETTAIINIHKRIKLKFGSGSGIAVSRSELGGLKTVIRIIVSEGN